jgi:predicted lactoylglutathione lyase
MNSKFPGAVPEIPVTDINKSLVYYKDNFGFTVDWFADDTGLAGISRGDCRMFLASSSFCAGHGNSSPVLIWLNLNSNAEVDELYRAWSESGAILVSEPESKPWGLHEFTAKDPDGNLFRIFYDFGTAEKAAKK